jgi:DNA-binding NarL/FixJ family response regulator
MRCLIIDDSPGFLEAARGLLEREGVTVVGVASTGSEAIQRIRELRPEVTLLDIRLGTESGFQVARRIQREAGPEPSPVILISTHSGEDFADLIAATPVLGFLPKAALSARAVRDMLETKGALAESVPQVSEPPGT